MSRKLPDRLLVVAFAGIFLLQACAAPFNPKVGLRQHSADLVFGIPPLEDPGGPPQTSPDSGFDIKARTPDRSQTAIPRSTLRRCPDAEFLTVEKDATLSVEGHPPIGAYPWKVNGDYYVPGFSEQFGRIRLPISNEKEVLGVTSLPPPAENPSGTNDFSFVVREKEIAGTRTFELTFDVITSRLRRDLNGIFLSKIRIFKQTERGLEEQRPFNPRPAVKYLPLPVTLGEQAGSDTFAAQSISFASTGVDPDSFAVLEHRGFVKSRERWDACGQMIDSIFVESEQTYSFGEDTYKSKYNYGVATQYGGMIVFEHVQKNCVQYNSETKMCEPEPDKRWDSNIGRIPGKQ